MTEPATKDFFNDSVFGKIVKVTLEDNRILYGNLHCVDSRKNLVLMDAIEQIPSPYIAPISAHLKLFIRYPILAQNYLSLPQEITEDKEIMEEINAQFAKDKFLVGQVIVPGNVVTKLEIQK